MAEHWVKGSSSSRLEAVDSDLRGTRRRLTWPRVGSRFQKPGLAAQITAAHGAPAALKQSSLDVIWADCREEQPQPRLSPYAPIWHLGREVAVNFPDSKLYNPQTKDLDCGSHLIWCELWGSEEQPCGLSRIPPTQSHVPEVQLEAYSRVRAAHVTHTDWLQFFHMLLQSVGNLEPEKQKCRSEALLLATNGRIWFCNTRGANRSSGTVVWSDAGHISAAPILANHHVQPISSSYTCLTGSMATTREVEVCRDELQADYKAVFPRIEDKKQTCS